MRTSHRMLIAFYRGVLLPVISPFYYSVHFLITIIMRSTFTLRNRQFVTSGHGIIQSFNHSGKYALLLLLLQLLMGMQLFAQVAPLPSTRSFLTGPAKFNIDGYLKRQSATSGDWLKGETGSGLSTDFIFDSTSGTTSVPLAYHIVDLYTSSDKIFDGSNRATDAITAWKWKTASASNKANINNALCYVAKDDAGETWGMFSADRQSASGATSIDFEFLQAKLDWTNPLGSSGSFTGTRTIGDLIVTVQFTGNSSTPAAILFYRWSGTDYVLFTPASTEGFALTNNNFIIRVPYTAYGVKTYSSNQFIEGAINISKLITRSSNNDPCIGYDFRTLLVKSKSTSDISGNLEDFAEPIQFNPELSINSATISYASPFCQDLGGTANWQPVSFGQNSITTGAFSVDPSSPSGLVLNSSGSIDIANSTPGTYTVNFTYNPGTACNTTATASAQVTIKPQLLVPAFSTTGAGCGTSGAVSITNFVSGATYTLSQNGTAIYTTTTSSFNTVAAGNYVLTVSKAGSCPASANVQVANNSALTVTPITGTTTVCVGLTTTLQDATADGVWTTADGNIATVNSSSGVVTGVAEGQVNITYTVTGGWLFQFCCNGRYCQWTSHC
jgi:hypothetical protein